VLAEFPAAPSVAEPSGGAPARSDLVKQQSLPALLTSGEVAELLRTTRKAVYSMVERGQLPGVVRIGRRVLFQQQALVDWLGQKTSPSLEGGQR
jgi:excisionase family DNA binding protein